MGEGAERRCGQGGETAMKKSVFGEHTVVKKRRKSKKPGRKRGKGTRETCAGREPERLEVIDGYIEV